MANIDFSAWDAGKAWSAGAKSDNPAAFYRGICAGKKSGDPSKQGSWALPYRYSPSSPPNAAGVRNALSRLSQTQGLTNKSEAEAKLNSLMKEVQAAEKNRSDSEHEMRMWRLENRSEMPGGDLRRKSFPSEIRGKMVKQGGRSVYEVEGYATVYDRGYEMWDRAGSYTEVVSPRALDRSLANAPDVAFLVNHAGVAMARSRSKNGSPTLILRSDSAGLHIQAWLNADRADVQTLSHAIDDGDIDEMSFAFRIEPDGFEWDEDYTQLTLKNIDINRGDVSAVNFGANPFTSIYARAADWLSDVEHMPEVVVREALNRVYLRGDSDAIVSEWREAAMAVMSRNAEIYARAAELNEQAALTLYDEFEEDLVGDTPAPRKTRSVQQGRMYLKGSVNSRREQLNTDN